MGKLRYILFICLVLVMTSCEGLFYNGNVGNPIRFGIPQQSPKTRTSYSDEYDGRIDWTDGDKITIYMDWDDGNGYYGSPRENGIYEVYGIHENGKESHGRIRYASGDILKWQGDFSGNDGRAHEYPHTFWSVYPYTTSFADGKFEFSLPSNQDNINDVSGLGLAAYEKGINSAKDPNSEGYVELHYYPMFTTFDVTVNNNSKKNIIGNLKLASENKYISGTYYVRVDDNKFVFDSFDPKNSEDYIEKAIGTLPDGGSKKLMYFIANTDYNSGDLYFSFEDGVKHPIDKEIVGGKKYNITITVNEKNVEVEEPKLSGFVNGAILAEAHKKDSPFYHSDWQFGWVDGEQKIFWNNPDNYNNWEPVPDELLWEIIEGLVDLDVEGTWEMGYVVTPDDLNIFPNLRTVNIKGWFQNVEINNPNITELNIESTQLNNLHIHGCNSLTTFHVENNNNFKNIVVEDCEILEYFTLTGPSGEGVNITCDSCPVLEWFSLTGGVNDDGSPWNFPFHKDIINCPMFDHYNVPGCREY